MAKKHVPFVIAYDFDGTLSPGNMQEYDFVPALGIKPADFWREAKAMAQEQQADEILAYMRLMIEKAQAARVPVRKKNFADFGAHIQLYPGVQDWSSASLTMAAQGALRSSTSSSHRGCAR